MSNPVKIFIDVSEAAKRLEELIDLASRHDEVHVCRGEQPVWQLSALPVRNELSRDDTPFDIKGDDRSSMPAKDGKNSPIDEVWVLAAQGKPRRTPDLTPAHHDLYNEDGLPK